MFKDFANLVKDYNSWLKSEGSKSNMIQVKDLSHRGKGELRVTQIEPRAHGWNTTCKITRTHTTR